VSSILDINDRDQSSRVLFHRLCKAIHLPSRDSKEWSFALYRPVSRNEIVEKIEHLSALHRQSQPTNASEARAQDRREAATRTLLANIPRTKHHPTLKTLLEVANNFSLTVEGAHRLFGYNLASIRTFDLMLNGGRTHIIDSYGFERDVLIDLPVRLASEEMFSSNRMLQDLVIEWQRDVPFRVIDRDPWHQPGTFYVHIGTEDSLGSSLPPGSIAIVEPIDAAEISKPSPRSIYLLQFSHGYRCGYCVVSQGRLHFISSDRTTSKAQGFPYPSTVRIAGRIKAFTLSLPSPEYPNLQSLPSQGRGAGLILPWEHRTRDRLFDTGHRRFERSKEQEKAIRAFLEQELQTRFSERTERRYRQPSSSQPHVDALISMTLANMARYRDSLLTSGVVLSDTKRYSLQALLKAQQPDDLLQVRPSADFPSPSEIWRQRRNEFIEWPSLLSLKFPQIQLWQDRILRLSEATSLQGLDPPLSSGSWVLLEKLPAMPDTHADLKKTGWSRPIYVLQRGLQAICGYLDRDENRYVLLSSHQEGQNGIFFGRDELTSLSRVAGVAVPV
jgi:hypothetical protein